MTNNVGAVAGGVGVALTNDSEFWREAKERYDG